MIPPVLHAASPQLSSQMSAQKSNDDVLREAAKALETSFLAEMLKSAGVGKTRDSFGGGAGEDQFASFLVTEQARAMVDAGGIGLTETVFNALKERSGE